MKYVKAYRVVQAVWGADRPEMLYFRTKEAAENYLNNNNYCNMISPKRISEKTIAEYKRTYGCSIFDD